MSHSHFGEGVYFTSLSPLETQSKIAHNNWDDGEQIVEAQIRNGRVESYIMVPFPDDDPNLEDVSETSKRNIWLYKGDFNFDDYPDTTVGDYND